MSWCTINHVSTGQKQKRALIIGFMIPTFRINFPASPIFEFDNHPLSDLKSYEVRKIEKTRKPQIFALLLMTIFLGKQNMVFCYQNCSNQLWEKFVLVIENIFSKLEPEGQESAKFLRSQGQFVRKVKGQNNFGNRNLFLEVSQI